MARQCTNCGVQNDDSTVFCTNCGTPLQEPAQAPQPQNKLDEILAKLKLSRPQAKKYGIMAIAAIAVIIVAVILINVIFPGPKAVVKKFLNAVEKGNAKAIVNCMPSFMWEDEDEKDEMIEELEEMYEDYEIESVEYEIKEVKKLSNKDQKYYEEIFEYYEDINDEFDADKVTDYKKAEVKVVIETDDGKIRETVDFILIKYKGQWKIFSSGGIF